MAQNRYQPVAPESDSLGRKTAENFIFEKWIASFNKKLGESLINDPEVKRVRTKIKALKNPSYDDLLICYQTIINTADNLADRAKKNKDGLSLADISPYLTACYENDFFVELSTAEKTDLQKRLTLNEEEKQIFFREKKDFAKGLNKKIAREFPHASVSEGPFQRMGSVFSATPALKLIGVILAIPITVLALVYYLPTLLKLQPLNFFRKISEPIISLVNYNPSQNGRLMFTLDKINDSELSITSMGHQLRPVRFTGAEKQRSAFKAYIEHKGEDVLYIGNLKSGKSILDPEIIAESSREAIIRKDLGDRYVLLPADNQFLWNGSSKSKALKGRAPQDLDLQNNLYNTLLSNDSKNDLFIPEALREKLGLQCLDTKSDNFLSSRQKKVVDQLIRSAADASNINLEEKDGILQLNKLKGEDQVNLKINLFKAVLPAYMAKTLNVKRMFCVCKDGIDRGGMTAVMTSLFFKYFNFENSGFTRRSDTCEKDVFQDLKVVISAAIAKGRDVNVHKKGFEQLSSILESKLSSEESQHICAPNQPDHLYDHDAPRSMSNRKKTSF